MALKLPSGITLYLARHGQTLANEQHRFSGKKDTPLTALGLGQARAVGQVMRRELGPKPDIAFVSSPYARAQATMRLVREALDLPPGGYAIEPRLQEINLGSWDQRTDEEARAMDPKAFDARMADKWNVHVPGGGENYQEAAARASAWVEELRQDTFAVTHGAILRILRGLFLGLDWQGMNRLDEMQGVVFRMRGSRVDRLEDD